MISKKLIKSGDLILKISLVVIAFAFLIYQLFIKKDIIVHFEQFKKNLDSKDFIIYVIFAVFLMPFNWLIEAMKWRFLISKSETISVLTSFKAIIAGISLAAITPNRVGEYFARLFVLKKTRFWEGVFMTIIGSFSQSILTIIFGLLSILYFIILCPNCINLLANNGFLVFIFSFGTVLGILILLILYFKIAWISSFIPQKWKKIRIYSKILLKYSTKELFIVLIYSNIRYLIFSIQYILLMFSLNIDVRIQDAIFMVSIIFFLNTINPSIALLDLGVRGSIAIFVFELYCTYYLHKPFDAELMVLLASTMIWFINIVIPAFFGLFFVKDFNFFRIKNKKENG